VRRRYLPLSLLALAVPAAVIAIPVASAPAPTAHPVAPKTYHVDVAPSAIPASMPGGDYEHSAVVEPQPGPAQPQQATKPFRAVGLSWTHDPGVTSLTAEVRVRTDGAWTDWQELDSTDIGASGAGDVDPGRTGSSLALRDGTDPLWVDHADGVQVAITSVIGDTPKDLRVDLIDPGTSAADASAGTAPSVQTAVADAAQPAILTRAQWGADESLRERACPSGPEYSSALKVAFVHHTVTGNGYAAGDVPAIIRSIYAYHVEGEGWCDIGYNFLVDRFGRIWEGRFGGIDKAVLGAQAGGFNTDSFGVALIGTFTTATPPQAMVDATARVIAWKLAMAYDNPAGRTTLTAQAFSGSRFATGTLVPLNVISGHRDVDFTDCPGAGAYNLLPEIRQEALKDIGAGLVAPSASVTAPRTVSANGSVRVSAGMLAAGDWQLAVQDGGGNTVRTITGSGSSIATTWDMTTDAGTPVPTGRYTLSLTSTQNGVTARPWTTAIDVGAVFGAVEHVTASIGQVEVTGWAARGTDTLPASLAVTVSSATAGSGTTTLPRPDVAASYPGYGTDLGYDITVPATAGYHTVCVMGDNSSLGLPATSLGCVGVTVPGLVTGHALPKGHLEIAWPAPGAIRVGGWALDPDTTAPIAVHLYVDGMFWAAITASGDRPDVGAAFPGMGADHGFSTTLTGFLGGTHTLCVYGINAGGGTNPQIGCSKVTLPGGNPRGSLDVAQGLPGAIRVAGWMIDPDTPDPITTHVYIDGVWAARTTADANRPDVAAAFSGYGAAHGYDVTIPLGSGGTHQVCVYGINVGLGTVNPKIACKSVTLPTGKPVGTLDAVTGQAGGARVRGWSIDPDTTSPVMVHIYVDGNWATRFSADASRPDVAAVFAGYGALHGFDAVVSMKPGKHTVCAYAINVGPAEPNPLLGCKSVTVASQG
jgi:N-acetylmuramoyl-L-alanine amidase/FlgD Ig-like domain